MWKCIFCLHYLHAGLLRKTGSLYILKLFRQKETRNHHFNCFSLYLYSWGLTGSLSYPSYVNPSGTHHIGFKGSLITTVVLSHSRMNNSPRLSMVPLGTPCTRVFLMNIISLNLISYSFRFTSCILPMLHTFFTIFSKNVSCSNVFKCVLLHFNVLRLKLHHHYCFLH